MQLSQQQVDHYARNGYLQCDMLFTPEEVNLMRAELPGLIAEDSPRRILETSGAVRTIFASHETNEVFKCVTQLARMVEPAQQLIGSDVYVHQFKINAKVGLDGERWEWHQDFLFWNKEDGMPTPNVLTAAIFLNDVDDFNGPMLLIPGSQTQTIDLQAQETKAGDASWTSTLTADLKYKVSKDIIASLQQKHGITASKGVAGTVLFFHGDVFHASSSNLSARDRFTVFVTFNSIDNKLVDIPNPRPSYIASRNFDAIQPLPDAALRQFGEYK